MHKNLTRFPHSRSTVTAEPWKPQASHPSIVFGQTIFRRSVRTASKDERVLKIVDRHGMLTP